MLLYSEYIYGGLTITTWGFTNSRGRCDFELGELRNFYVHLNSPIGDYPEGANEVVQIISYSLSEAHYYKTFYIPNFLSIPRRGLAPPPAQPIHSHKFELEVGIPYEILHGYARARRDYEDTGYYHTYSEREARGSLDLFVVDEENFLKYEGGDEFEASLIAENIDYDTLEFVSPELKKWYLILSNEDVLATSRGLEIKIDLYKNPAVVVEEQLVAGQDDFWLGLASPNPFTESTHISFSVPYPRWTDLTIYDARGASIKTIMEELLQPGIYTIPWDGFDSAGREVSSGVYFYRLSHHGQSLTRKVVLMD